jgi:aryl-alcohol dehydrogenase-like predicted oxidoreductase
MNQDFTHTTLGSTGLPVCRLGLSATYRPGKEVIYRALDEGINYFFAFGIDKQMLNVMREVLSSDREKYVVATGAYNLLWGHPNLRRTLEKRLRQLGTDYIDVFLFLGVTKEKHLTDHVREELYRFREEGKIRSVGISTHNRKFAGRLAAEGALDVIMMRYNAAHRGAEQDIFPHLAKHNPGVVSFTATRWRYLLRRPRGWPRDGRIPTAGLCYRFVLSNPHVHVCMAAPSNMKQLGDVLEAFRQGPLAEEEMDFMRKFGDAVYNMKKWFM